MSGAVGLGHPQAGKEIKAGRFRGRERRRVAITFSSPLAHAFHHVVSENIVA